MAFQLFEEYGSASREHATLRASGAIFLPNAVLNQSEVSSPEAARLHFDVEGKKLGIELVAKLVKGDRSARKMSVEGSGRSISVQPVLRFYGLNQPAKKLDLNVAQENGMLVVDLASLTPGRRGRKPKSA